MFPYMIGCPKFYIKQSKSYFEEAPPYISWPLEEEGQKECGYSLVCRFPLEAVLVCKHKCRADKFMEDKNGKEEARIRNVKRW